MKNSLKIGFVIFGIAISAIACDPAKTGSTKAPIDSNKSTVDTSQKMIDTAKNTGADTIKKDSVKKK